MTNKIKYLLGVFIIVILGLQSVKILTLKQELSDTDLALNIVGFAFRQEHEAFKACKSGNLKAWQEENRRQFMEKLNKDVP